jgi:hypothetical protein
MSGKTTSKNDTAVRLLRDSVPEPSQGNQAGRVPVFFSEVRAGAKEGNIPDGFIFRVFSGITVFCLEVK